MKRFTYLLFLVLLALSAHAQRAKYVFFFIGDGMGLNQVNTTEMYLGEQNGRIGTQPLTFASFPVAGMATTYSATNSITDSAAGGTALATGSKTYNGAIGVDPDKQTLTSVAEQAKRSGRKVGVTTSVSIDHATPASFYAHQPDRGMYYEIAQDMLAAGFDFYAGGGFLKPDRTHDGRQAPSIFPQIEQAGYTLARGVDEYQAKCDAASKMVLIQKEGADPASLPYAIDRRPGDLTLKQITESAIDFLTRDNNKGFFLMVEGGKIDWACHNNDVATAVNEVMDLDEAVKVAYDFYQKHPKETLIVITADHETGGLGLGRSGYTLALKSLANQDNSQEMLSRAITDLRKDKAHKATWDDVKALLSREMGFWTELPISWEQEKMLRDVYEESFVHNHVKFAESMYAKTEPLAAAARQVMSQLALVGWTSGDHTAEYVPVFAIGAGSQAFSGKMDNTDIPKRIAKAAGYK